jgi:acid-sensing ion channel, other
MIISDFIALLCFPCLRVKNERINILFETDKKWALTIIPTKSAKVFVHSTEEVTSHDYRPTFMFDVGYQIDLLITMKQTYTTDDARQLSIGQRKCIFPDEVKLKYYKNDTYSFTACMKHCRMEKANKLCKCIPPFYAPASGNYRHCGLDDFGCLDKHRDNITDIKNCRQCELSCLNTVYDIEKYSRG